MPAQPFRKEAVWAIPSRRVITSSPRCRSGPDPQRELEMTRVHQARERARAIESKTPNALRDFGPPEEPVFRWQPAVTETTTPPAARPVAPGPTPTLRCPKCRGVQEGSPRGAWMTRVLTMMRIPPYRCSVCRSRVSRFDRETDQPATDQLGGAFRGFLPTADGRSFADIIVDMSRTEREERQSQPPA